jgi:hypothetical protein
LIEAIDNTFLTLLLNPGARPRPNPITGKPTEYCRQRIDALIDNLSNNGGTLLIPAPALAEALCVSHAAELYFNDLQQYAAIEIATFDGMAALEFGRFIRAAIKSGDKRSGQTGEWQQMKMDRAIVAIALSRSVTTFYSDDDGQIKFAKRVGLNVKSTWDLDLPPDHAQIHMSEHAEEPWPAQKKPVKSKSLEKQPGE